MPGRKPMDMTLCMNLCSYFKPGKSEEMACQGYVVVQRMITDGRGVPLARPARLARPDPAALARLHDAVCQACVFREHDCDHIATGGTAVPCGGLLLLAHLVASGELRLDEIELHASRKQ
jgi:hypothetical protein